MASVYSLNGSGEWSGKGSFLEVRIGKFPVGKASDRVVREIVVGAAFGDIKNWLGGERLDACFLKPFIQPSIGVTSRFLDAAFTTRLAVVSYLSQSEAVHSENGWLVEDFFNEKKNTFVLEPCITL